MDSGFLALLIYMSVYIYWFLCILMCAGQRLQRGRSPVQHMAFRLGLEGGGKGGVGRGRGREGAQGGGGRGPAVNKMLMRLAPLVGRAGGVSEGRASAGGRRE